MAQANRSNKAGRVIHCIFRKFQCLTPAWAGGARAPCYTTDVSTHRAARTGIRATVAVPCGSPSAKEKEPWTSFGVGTSGDGHVARRSPRIREWRGGGGVAC